MQASPTAGTRRGQFVEPGRSLVWPEHWQEALGIIVLRDGPLHQIPARPALPVHRQLNLQDGFARAVRARRA